MEIIVILSCPLWLQEGQERRGPYALPGVVEDRRGWQWPPGWFLTLLIIIWSNFCFLNFLVFCSYLGQEWRGPYALLGVMEDRRGWQWPPGWFLTWLFVILSNFCLQNIVLKSFIWNLRWNSPLRNIPVLQGSRRKKMVLTPDF